MTIKESVKGQASSEKLERRLGREPNASPVCLVGERLSAEDSTMRLGQCGGSGPIINKQDPLQGDPLLCRLRDFHHSFPGSNSHSSFLSSRLCVEAVDSYVLLSSCQGLEKQHGEQRQAKCFER